jgi:phage terminase large subunit-like protein
MTCGLEKTITGKHCNRLVLDDIVVPENNTEQGRKQVNSWLSQAASIMSADSCIFDVGTRYHPKDAHQVAMDMVYDDEIEDEYGEITTSAKSLFTVSMANVEEDGEFLWERQQRKDGKWFGFNKNILARKRAVYEAAGEITQFYAQYYNDPNDKSTAPIARELFKYYDKEELDYTVGLWSIQGKPCFLYAAVDLAATSADSSDYTAITVGAIDQEGNRYLVYANRFKTHKISVIYDEIYKVFGAYNFKKLRIEAVAGFRLAAQDVADRLYAGGVRIPIDLYIPPRGEGKAMRVNGILEPLYQSGAVYHYRGGLVQTLEDELVSAKPINEDLKDTWAMCNDLMKVPRARRQKPRTNVLQFNSRFGGVSR